MMASPNRSHHHSPDSSICVSWCPLHLHLYRQVKSCYICTLFAGDKGSQKSLQYIELYYGPWRREVGKGSEEKEECTWSSLLGTNSRAPILAAASCLAASSRCVLSRWYVPAFYFLLYRMMLALCHLSPWVFLDACIESSIRNSSRGRWGAHNRLDSS